MWDSIIVAVITGIFALAGTYFANRKAAALLEYRVQQLEKKIEIHNSVIDRTYKLEERAELQEAELKRQNERLKIVEAKT